MRSFKLIVLALAGCLADTCASSQNVLINVLTQHAGIVKKGHSIFLEVSINNTDPVAFVNIYKLRAQVSVPEGMASIPLTGHNLPTGWTITSNDGSTITLSNGTDMISANDARTLLIAIKGEKIGGPLTVSGQLSFANGTAPGTSPGNMPGDNPADNSSTSTCRIIK